MKDGVEKAINFFSHPKNVSSKDKLVFVVAIFSEDSRRKICEVIRHIVKICHGLQETVFIYQNEDVSQEYYKGLSENVNEDEWKNHSLQVTWEQLTSFVKANNQYKTCKELLFPSTSGVPTAIKPQVIDHYKKEGLETALVN